MTFTASWAAGLVAAFDSSGLHRASTPGDYASGEWLAARAREAGGEVSTMQTELPRTVVEEAWLELGADRIDGLPMFDSPATGRIEGVFGPCGKPCDIGYLELAPGAAAIKGMSFEALRRDSRHAALVVATRVAGESLAPINAQYFPGTFGPPVLQVAGMHHAALEQWAQSRTPAVLMSRHHQVAAQSFNVAARITPPRPEGAIVVLTPRTGWWESTAERGGGLIGWLAGIRTAAQLGIENRLRRTVHAFATCGHELGHVGLHALLKQETALLKPAVKWLHLGANLGCASNATLILRASEPTEAQHMQALLVSEGYPAQAIQVDPISTASGEARDVMEHGGNVLSMIGRNAHFHAASDRWPANVNAERVAAVARAVNRWVAERVAV